MRRLLGPLLLLALPACIHDLLPAGPLDGSAADATLTIAPGSVVLVLPSGASTSTQTFVSERGGVPVSAAWSTDRPELGSIDAAGVYAPRGDRGGKAHVLAAADGQVATASITVSIATTQNGDPAFPQTSSPGPGGYGGVGGNGPGGPVTGKQRAALDQPPVADPAIRWLYPYDGTVFPRGLLAPLLQWDAAGHVFSAARVRISAQGGTYDYDGYFARPAAAPFVNLPIPQASWAQMSYSASGDQVTVRVTLLEDEVAYGPLTLRWTIAPGTLRGVVYYNSYGTNLVTNSDLLDSDGNPIGAGTLAIRPGQTDPTLVAGSPSPGSKHGCRVCHVVARDGARLLTQTGDDYDAARLFELASGPADQAITGRRFAFPALSPDGQWMFSSGRSWDGSQAAPSALYALPAATPVATTGLPPGLQAATPSFSSDGTLLAFNLWGGPGADRRSLATLAFDPAALAFGALTTIYTPPPGASVAWPSFLPSQQAIVFEESFDTAAWGETRDGNKGRLAWATVSPASAHRLDRLDGVGYLPVGDGLHADDSRFDYEPTVNPVASGGYAWVVFTSRRIYGNVATIDPFSSDPARYAWRTQPTTKKLWVAAIDLGAAPGSDPSHPAFYLPGQELYAGNSRGFWSVEPCRGDGAACETSDECCGGSCGSDGSALVCGAPPPGGGPPVL